MNPWRRLLAVTVAAAVLGAPLSGVWARDRDDQGDSGARALTVPFRTVSPRQGAGAGACPAPPTPPNNLTITTPYQKGDATFSHIDPQAERAVNDLMKPIRDFDVAVDVQANRYTFSNGANEAAGACALAMLDAWAKAGAVAHLGGHDAYLFRANMITALSLDFMQVRGLDTGDPGQRRRIAEWLHSLGADTMNHWAGLPNDAMVNLNNHRAWAGLAAASAGLASGDGRLFDWGVQSGQVVLCEADSHGALPREILRAGRARLYSLYTAEPLVMIAELAEPNGVDLYSQCGGALHRIVAFALKSVDDPSDMEQLAGARQEAFYKPDGSFNKAQIAWADVYEHRFPGRAPLPANFAAGRPYFAPDLGGSVGLLFSR